MSVFEYSFFLLVGFIPIYNLVCIILNNNQQDFDKLNIKINMLIYSNEQLKTKILNIISQTKMDKESSPPIVEEKYPIMEETPINSASTVVEPPSVVEDTSSIDIPIDTSIDTSEDESDIDFVQDRVRNDKASQNLSYFISSKLTNMSSNFF